MSPAQETEMADPNLPEPAPYAILMTLVGPVVSAGVGVVMRHAQRAATGKPFSLRRLSFELPSVIGLGIMGGALGDWLGAAETVRWGLAATLGYLGPQVVEVVFYRWIARQDPS
jgi:hypothetical protein